MARRCPARIQDRRFAKSTEQEFTERDATGEAMAYSEGPGEMEPTRAKGPD